MTKIPLFDVDKTEVLTARAYAKQIRFEDKKFEDVPQPYGKSVSDLIVCGAGFVEISHLLAHALYDLDQTIRASASFNNVKNPWFLGLSRKLMS